MPDFWPLTRLPDLEDMPPSLLTLSLASGENNRRKLDAMRKMTEERVSQTEVSGNEKGAARIAPEHQQSAKSDKEK